MKTLSQSPAIHACDRDGIGDPNDDDPEALAEFLEWLGEPFDVRSAVTGVETAGAEVTA
jgi:hypothetical protein